MNRLTETLQNYQYPYPIGTWLKVKKSGNIYEIIAWEMHMKMWYLTGISLRNEKRIMMYKSDEWCHSDE